MEGFSKFYPSLIGITAKFKIEFLINFGYRKLPVLDKFFNLKRWASDSLSLELNPCK